MSPRVGKSPRQRDPIPILEWAAAAFGFAVALLLLGILGRAALTSPNDPVPELSVRAGRLVPGAGSHVLTIDVVNQGATTAAAVQVEGTLKQGEEEVETSSATIDYVPGHSQAAAGLIFKEDPRAHELELRVTGYKAP